MWLLYRYADRRADLCPRHLPMYPCRHADLRRCPGRECRALVHHRHHDRFACDRHRCQSWSGLVQRRNGHLHGRCRDAHRLHRHHGKEHEVLASLDHGPSDHSSDDALGPLRQTADRPNGLRGRGAVVGLHHDRDSDRLSTAATITERLREINRLVTDYIHAPARVSDGSHDLLKTAENIILARAKRRKYLRSSLFIEPDWDMLLDLYVAGLRDRTIAVTSLCIAANAPPTTALRHISVMVQHGEIIRVPDPEDRRRAYLKLSDETRVRITAWINDCT